MSVDPGVSVSSDTGSAAPAPEATSAAPAAAPSWRDQFLDSDMRGDPTLSRFDSVPALAKSYLEARKKIGEQGVRYPGPEASPEQKAEFWRAIGAPESVDGYQFGEREVSPEARSLIHAANLTQDQANALVEHFEKFVTDQGSERSQSIEAAEARSAQTIRQEWGPAFEKKAELAATAAHNLFGDQFDAWADLMGPNGVRLGMDPVFLNALSSYGESMAEHGKLKGVTPRQYAMTPQEAQSKLSDLIRQPNAYNDPQIIRQIGELNQIIATYAKGEEQ